MKDLGKIIAQNRKENKMNQCELARLLENYGISVKQSSISSWESGITQPSARQLLAICEIFGIYDIYTEFIGKKTVVLNITSSEIMNTKTTHRKLLFTFLFAPGF